MEAVDLAESEISPQVLSQLQANKVVGMGSYQYGESEQSVRAVMKARYSFRVKYNLNESNSKSPFVGHRKNMLLGVWRWN